jgi:hypothetical protein
VIHMGDEISLGDGTSSVNEVLRNIILESTEEELREATGKDFDNLAEQGRAIVEKSLKGDPNDHKKK